jgi:glycosyltransferase involved in cell wall biosynthesis
MRIAYINSYQGPTLVEQRPIVRNRSLSTRIKTELIARLLQANGHEVEIISHGEVIEHGLRFYPGFWETELFHPEIPVYYVSSLPIRRINSFWASLQAVRAFKKQHRECPFDLVIILNFKSPQISCAAYAVKHLGLPVILQYEDDAFRQKHSGEEEDGWLSRYRRSTYAKILSSVSGCMSSAPRLLSQVRAGLPLLLLRGVVDNDLVEAGQQEVSKKPNWVVFSGTHVKPNGVKELINGWKMASLSDWQLHITGFGELTEELRKMAAKDPSIMFRGMISREEFVSLLRSAKICISPHVANKIPGNVFSFKIIEYLAAGAHVVMTPEGNLEADLEAGITYMSDNSPPTIAATLQRVIRERSYERTAPQAAVQSYGEASVLKSLDTLIQQVMRNREGRTADPGQPPAATPASGRRGLATR